jgi:hypothetical protein
LEQPVEVRSGPFWAAKEAELRTKRAAFYKADFWAFSAGSSKPNLGQNSSTSQAIHRLYQPAVVQDYWYK